MNARLALQIALRHLGARRRQTLLAMLGVTIGGGIFALMVAITAGQQEFLESKLIEVSPHILLTADRLQPVTTPNLLKSEPNSTVELRVHTPSARRKELKPATELIARTEQLAPEVTAVSPYVAVQGVFRNGTRYQTVEARGVDPLREQRIARLASSMHWGRMQDLAAAPDGAVIGSGLARKLNLDVGTTFTFVTPGGTLEQLKVVGIFESGVANLDDRRGYINLALAQSLRGMSRNAVTGFSIQVRDLDRVGQAKTMIEEATGYKAQTWQEANTQILEFQGRQSITSRLLVIFVFVTAAFGVSNMLAAVVLGKKQDIAVMKSFGMTRAQVTLVFLLEGLAIGFLGGLLAAALGYALAHLFGSLHLVPQNSDRAYVRFDRFPVSLDPAIYAGTFALALLMAVLASMLPARRAARFIPVRIIRGEA